MLKRGRVALVIALALVGSMVIEAQQPAGAPYPSPEHKKLSVFVGTWKDDAELKSGPFGPDGKILITETCDWFTGGFSLVCHSESTGLTEGKALSMLNYDPEEKVYTFYELNSFGLTNSAKGTVDGDTWTFNGDVKMGGKLIKTRFTITLPSPDFATMKSEMSVDGSSWNLVMQLKGSRIKQSLTDLNSCPHSSEGWVFQCFPIWLGLH